MAKDYVGLNSTPCVMKDSLTTSCLLRLRNIMHAVIPAPLEALELFRQSLRYSRLIGQHGYEMPLPPYIKRSIILRYALDHHCNTLVETGTQYGDTPWAFRHRFEKIYTIELSAMLTRIAKSRFRSYPHIEVVEGNSGEKLRDLLPLLDSKTIFWLDGHYSAGMTARGQSGCPILSELRAVATFCPVPYIILIDDARCFGQEDDYPSLKDLEAFVQRLIPTTSFNVSNDIIAIVARDTSDSYCSL
jgi:hypothetical protein